MGEWFEDTDFWQAFYPVMFRASRWQAAEEEVGAMLALAEPPSGGRVLDICCGPGRHAVALAARGFDVVGVDLTAAYLERASSHARQAGVQVEFIQSDARDFTTSRPFDLAISFFTSFGYFANPEEDGRLLEGLRNAVKPGGKVLMDMSGKEVVKRHFQQKSWSELEDGGTCLEEHTPFDDWNGIENRWILIRGPKRSEKTFRVRLYSGEQLRSQLLGAGFSSVTLYGNLEGDPYDDRARRLIAVAER